MTTANDLASKLADEYDLPKNKAKALIDSVFSAITTTAAAGDEISIPSFGKFKVKSSPARDGRNPATGETIKIAASKKLTFAPAKALKDMLNN